MPPTRTTPRPDQDEHNVGQQHSDDLFEHFEREYENPSGSQVGEDAAIDRAKAATRDQEAPAEGHDSPSSTSSNMAKAEQAAAARPKNSITREDLSGKEVTYGMPSAEDFYRKSKENRKGTKNPFKLRGIFIGVGAGGGLVSIIAGFAFLLPFKLPAIMDNIVNDAGKRVERVVERRAERVLLRFFINGSDAACTIQNCIATGNPIGDLFANIRTAKFEKTMLEQSGIKLEPGPNKTVKLVQDGKELGNVRNTDDILKILAKGEAGKSLSLRDIRKIVRSQIPMWRFFKRAKFVNWLRLKYNIPRFGSRKQQPDETDEKYNKQVKTDGVNNVEGANVENIQDLSGCISDDQCDTGDNSDQKPGDAQTKGAQQVAQDAEQAVQESVDEVTNAPSNSVTKKLSDLILEKILKSTIAKIAAGSLAGVGIIDTLSSVDHLISQSVQNQLIQKLHAKYMKNSYTHMFASFAGYADQTKAGDLGTSAVGMISDQFNGEEQAASYNLIASGSPVGQTLTAMQKVGETSSALEFPSVIGDLYGTVGLVVRAPLILWYATVHPVLKAVADWASTPLTWLIGIIPVVSSLMSQITPHLIDLFTGLFKLVGMDVDPLDTGAKLHLDVHAGAVSAFNENCKDMGCRKLSHDEAAAEDQLGVIERQQDLAGQSTFDRLFNLNNEDSLAANILTGVPTPQSTDPIGMLAFTTGSLVARAPTNLAAIVTPSAVASGTSLSEDLYGITPYGGTDNDLDTDVAPQLFEKGAQCPANNPNGDSFNTCAIDKQIVDSMNCTFVECPDMQANDNNDMFDTFADVAPSTPSADNVNLSQHVATSAKNDSGNILAAFLPLAALELSRRRGQ